MKFLFRGKVKTQVKTAGGHGNWERSTPWALYGLIVVMLPHQQLCTVMLFYDYGENIIIKLWLCIADTIFNQLDQDTCGPSFHNPYSFSTFIFFSVGSIGGKKKHKNIKIWIKIKSKSVFYNILLFISLIFHHLSSFTK